MGKRCMEVPSEIFTFPFSLSDDRAFSFRPRKMRWRHINNGGKCQIIGGFPMSLKTFFPICNILNIESSHENMFLIRMIGVISFDCFYQNHHLVCLLIQIGKFIRFEKK